MAFYIIATVSACLTPCGCSYRSDSLSCGASHCSHGIFMDAKTAALFRPDGVAEYFCATSPTPDARAAFESLLFAVAVVLSRNPAPLVAGKTAETAIRLYAANPRADSRSPPK